MTPNREEMWGNRRGGRERERERERERKERERERERERENLDAKPHPKPAINHNDLNLYYSCFALPPWSEE